MVDHVIAISVVRKHALNWTEETVSLVFLVPLGVYVTGHLVKIVETVNHVGIEFSCLQVLSKTIKLGISIYMQTYPVKKGAPFTTNVVVQNKRQPTINKNLAFVTARSCWQNEGAIVRACRRSLKAVDYAEIGIR